jgi:hypothetical protein
LGGARQTTFSKCKGLYNHCVSQEERTREFAWKGYLSFGFYSLRVPPSIPSTFLRNTFLPGFRDHRPSKEKPRIEGSKNLNATTQPRRNPRMFAVYVYQFGEEGQVFFGLVLAVCVTEDFRKPALDVSKLSAPRLPPCQQPYGVPRYWEVCSPSCKESIVHPAKNLTLRGLLMNKKAPG